MRIRIIGCGWYGAHIASTLIDAGHDVDVYEKGDHIFCGASGAIPARLHLGAPHYPRSSATQIACQKHQAEFLAEYGFLTRPVPCNIYAVAADHSLVDFGTYKRALKDNCEFITLYDPAEFGLTNVEGAVMVPERHVLCDEARAYFEKKLAGSVQFGRVPPDDEDLDWLIDCSFAANSSAGIDRYEPCLVLLLKGRTDRAVTIVDGPFGSLYPWSEQDGLCSLSSAKFTPFSKHCRLYGEARELIDNLMPQDIQDQGIRMIEAMAQHYPAIMDFKVADHKLSIRAMPLSGADTRLVDIAQLGPKLLRVRAGKIDAVIHAGQEILRIIG